MEQMDGTVACHITRTSLPNERKAPPSSFCSRFLSIDRTKMLRFASSKGKGGTLMIVRVAPPTVWLARCSLEGTRVVLQFH